MLLKIKNRKFNIDKDNICITVFDSKSIKVYESNFIHSNDKKEIFWDSKIIPLEAIVLKLNQKQNFDLSFKKQNTFFFVMFNGDVFWALSDYFYPL